MAFSQDQKHKIYVQHVVEKEKAFLRNVILGDPKKMIIFVCGKSTVMPEQLQSAFEAVVDGIFFDVAGSEILKALRKSKQYFEELWE